MKIFNCILGIFAVFGSIYCICYPGVSFLHAGWIMTMLMGGWGICAMFDYAQNRKMPEKTPAQAAMGVISLIIGIAAAALSLIGLFVPAVRLAIDIVILIMLICWFLFSGIRSIIVSFAAKKTGIKAWWLSLILGILTVIGAFYGAFHLIFFAQVIGIGIGSLLMVYAVRLFCSLCEEN